MTPTRTPTADNRPSQADRSATRRSAWRVPLTPPEESSPKDSGIIKRGGMGRSARAGSVSRT
jgi:hypothetical protein